MQHQTPEVPRAVCGDRAAVEAIAVQGRVTGRQFGQHRRGSEIGVESPRPGAAYVHISECRRTGDQSHAFPVAVQHLHVIQRHIRVIQQDRLFEAAGVALMVLVARKPDLGPLQTTAVGSAVEAQSTPIAGDARAGAVGVAVAPGRVIKIRSEDDRRRLEPDGLKLAVQIHVDLVVGFDDLSRDDRQYGPGTDRHVAGQVHRDPTEVPRPIGQDRATAEAVAVQRRVTGRQAGQDRRRREVGVEGPRAGATDVHISQCR